MSTEDMQPRLKFSNAKMHINGVIARNREDNAQSSPIQASTCPKDPFRAKLMLAMFKS
jgi:hypothetical protein